MSRRWTRRAHVPTRRALALAIAGCATAAACGAPPAPPAGRAPTPDPVPPVGESRGPLRGSLPPIPRTAPPGDSITVRYPPRGATIATDSTFVFGSVGSADAALEINGVRVPVAPNGAFLAYLAVPDDGLYRFRASGGAAAGAELEWPVNGARAAGDPPAPERGDRNGLVTAISPAGPTLLVRGEPVTFAARAPAGAALSLVMPDGSRRRMTQATGAAGGMGFGETAARTGSARYEATLAPPEAMEDAAHIEAVVEGDTTEHALPPIRLLEPGFAHRVEVRTARPDSAAIGRATLPPGTPYHWFLPNGTRALLTGLRDGHARLRLTEALSIWVAASDVAPTRRAAALPDPEDGVASLLADAAPVPLAPPGQAAGDAYSVRVEPREGWAEIRIALSERLPFRVDARDGGLDVTVYGARTRTNWVYQGPADPDVRRVWWEQADDERYVVRVETAGTPWGWDARWVGEATLVVRVRRPPAVDPGEPLRGLYVGVDAGHGDRSGAIGPTGLNEGEANRRVARRLASLLRERGARVLETRAGPEDIGLGARPLMATDSGVHVLLSVHNNAFPDGVNPFEGAGTSVLYNTWQSLDLARALQRELVAELGLRDLGAIWGDLALARPTWMPSVLTETMFLMIPVQEAALRDPGVQERIAAAHVRGLEAFLRRRLER